MLSCLADLEFEIGLMTAQGGEVFGTLQVPSAAFAEALVSLVHKDSNVMLLESQGVAEDSAAKVEGFLAFLALFVVIKKPSIQRSPSAVLYVTKSTS